MNEQQHEQPARHSWMSTLAWVGLAFVFYLASAGPVCYLNSNRVISEASFRSLWSGLYFPIIFVDENSSFFREHPVGIAYGNYVEWFSQ